MGLEDYIKRFETDENLEEKLEHVRSVYVHWRDFIRNKENYKIKEGMKGYEKLKGKEEYNESLYSELNRFFDNFIVDCGEYLKILIQFDVVKSKRHLYKDDKDFLEEFQRIDSRRKRYHDALISNIGVINRLLASNLGLHDKIINNDPKNPYVGVYPNDPEHLYKNPKKDIEIEITQDLEKKDYSVYRSKISDTLLDLAYVTSKKSV